MGWTHGSALRTRPRQVGLVVGLRLALVCLAACAGPAAAAADGTAASPTAVQATELGRVAATLAPGQFRRLETGLPEGVASLGALLSGRRPDGRAAPPIDTWTDSAHWDPSGQRLYFQGLRVSNRFLTYAAQNNRWEEIGLDVPNAPPQIERFGHLYGRTALDADRGHFYRLVGRRLHRYDIAQQRWEVFPEGPLGGFISIDWHEGLDRLVGLAEYQVHAFKDGVWTALGRSAVHGYHSSARFNTRRGDMLFIGGNRSPREVALLGADGMLRPRAPAPFDFTIRADDLSYDPRSGNYLVLHHDGVLWEYQPDRDEWRVALRRADAPGAWPFRRGGIVPAVIDELGVVWWNHERGPFLYRHRSVFDATAAHPGPPVQEGSGIRAAPVRTSAAAAPPDLPQGSLLAEAAASLQPGEWRNLADRTSWEGKDRGRSFKSFQAVRALDGRKGGADGMGWTQTLVHHQGRLMLLLMRDRFERALLVMEPDGRFWRLNQPPGFEQTSHRRPFNKLTQDDRYLYFSPNIGRSRLGQMIRTPLDRPGTFEAFGVPIGDRHIVGQFAATYVPEWQRFYAYTPGGRLWSWAPGEERWTRHPDLPTDDKGHRLSGYAGLLLWNPVRRELAIVGGQNFGKKESTSHKVYRLTEPMGAPQMLADRRGPDGALIPWNSGATRMLVDPRDGSYLLLTKHAIYRHACAGGQFSLYVDLRPHMPFGAYEPYTPLVVLPGTDVVAFISHLRGLVLHRLRPLPAAAPSAPPCD